MALPRSMWTLWRAILAFQFPVGLAEASVANSSTSLSAQICLASSQLWLPERFPAKFLIGLSKSEPVSWGTGPTRVEKKRKGRKANSRGEDPQEREVFLMGCYMQQSWRPWYKGTPSCLPPGKLSVVRQRLQPEVQGSVYTLWIPCTLAQLTVSLFNNGSFRSPFTLNDLWCYILYTEWDFYKICFLPCSLVPSRHSPTYPVLLWTEQ